MHKVEQRSQQELIFTISTAFITNAAISFTSMLIAGVVQKCIFNIGKLFCASSFSENFPVNFWGSRLGQSLAVFQGEEISNQFVKKMAVFNPDSSALIWGGRMGKVFTWLGYRKQISDLTGSFISGGIGVAHCLFAPQIKKTQ